jgi:hypothetical protein
MLFGNPIARTGVKYGHELDNDIEIGPKKIVGGWTGFIWLWIEFSSGLL